MASQTPMRARFRALKSTRAWMLKATVCFSARCQTGAATRRTAERTMLLLVEKLYAFASALVVAEGGLVLVLIEFRLCIPKFSLYNIDWEMIVSMGGDRTYGERTIVD